MSTDQTLASDTDSSLETSAGPLGCCRWLAACLRNPVFFRRWRTVPPTPYHNVKRKTKEKKDRVKGLKKKGEKKSKGRNIWETQNEPVSQKQQWYLNWSKRAEIYVNDPLVALLILPHITCIWHPDWNDQTLRLASPVKCIIGWLLVSLTEKHFCYSCGKVGSHFAHHQPGM